MKRRKCYKCNGKVRLVADVTDSAIYNYRKKKRVSKGLVTHVESDVGDIITVDYPLINAPDGLCRDCYILKLQTKREEELEALKHGYRQQVKDTHETNYRYVQNLIKAFDTTTERPIN